MSDGNERAIIASAARVKVLLPLVFRAPFDYRVPEGLQVALGDYVRVPFGRKSVWGVVWGEGNFEIAEAKLKTIETVAAHLPPMKDSMRALIDWVSWYTLAPLGMVLKMALSVPDALEPPKREIYYKAVVAQSRHYRLTPVRQRILAYLENGEAQTLQAITAHAKVSAQAVRDFLEAGGLEIADETLSSPFSRRLGGGRAAHADTLSPALSLKGEGASALSPAQEAAAQELRKKLSAGFSTTLLDGVTGSGKTEVYFDLIAHAISYGKQALVLLPEIALSVQWLERFQQRFGFAPLAWHSGITPSAKRDAWRTVAEGSAQVVVGARSALFLPFKHLGAIIVDEEHDGSYKQEEGVIYHARDMAVARARQEKISALLVSATPSLETELNVQAGRYARLHLPHRHGGATLPEIRLLDMRQQKLDRGTWLSPALRSALAGTLSRGEQAMLFINRRGYAPLMLCRACGHRFQCPHCSAWLVLHRSHSRLLCHHCGHNVPVPKQCPDCKAEASLVPIGPGVERVAEEVRGLFPNARTEVMASDTIFQSPSRSQAGVLHDDYAGEISRSEIGSGAPPGNIIKSMSAGEIDLLIGTQMVAKGHHFAGLALVGVIDADMGLAGGDLRASERTYQLLHQLAGRAGREKTKGEVILQTYLPTHPVMQALAAGERDRFMQLEAEMREEAELPPYGKLAAIIIEGKKETEAISFARELVRGAPPHKEVRILGPAPAPLALLRGWYRFRLLVKAPRNFPVQPYLHDWLLARKIPSGLKLKIDVDPYSFY